MASPFYTPIRVNQSDFSPITTGAAAYGQAVGAGIEKIGAAVGQVASSYFKKKEFESLVDKLADDPMVRDYLKSKGQEFESEGEKSKFLKEMMNELGGPENFKNHLQTQLQYRSAKKAEGRAIDLYNLEKEQKQFLVDELKFRNEVNKHTNLYFQHLQKENKSGVKNIDSDDPIGDYNTDSPEALEAVTAVNKQMGIGRYDPALIGKLSASLAPLDEITGERLPHRNYTSEADLYKHTDQIRNSEVGRRISPELINAFIEREKANIDGAGDKPFAREIFKSELKASGFGAFAEAMKTNTGTMGNFRALLDETLIFKEDGTVAIKNPVAASVALMQMARMAQGAGVLSNQDVALIKGDQRIAASYERFIEKNLGESIKLTEDMIQQNPAWQNSVNPDTGEVFKVGDDVYLGGANLSSADMKMFQSLANALDSRATEFQKKVIPDIYKNVRATYGGFTIEQLNQFTDLHQYMPNGIVNLNPMSQVTTKQMDAVVNMMNDGMTESQAKNFLRQNSMSDPNTEYDEDTDGKAIDAMVGNVYSGKYKSRQNAHVQTYNDQAKYEGGTRTIDPPKKDPVDIGLNPDDKTDGKRVTTQLVGGAAGLYLGRKGSQNLNRGNAIEELLDEPSSRFKEANQKIAKGSAKEVKSMAKQMGLDPKDFKTDKALRSAMKKRLGAAVQGKVTEYLGRQGFKQRVIRRLIAGTVTSGAVGLTVSGASLLYDLYDLSQTSREIKKTELQKIQSKYEKGSKDYKLVQELINDLNPVRRLEKSDYYQQPEIGSMGFPFAP